MPGDGQRREEGAILIRLEEFKMIMKIETLKLLPQEKIMMKTGLMMSNK